MNGLHDLKIVGKGTLSDVYLDGTKLKAVTDIKFEHECQEVAKVTITMFVGTYEIEYTEDEENDKSK